MDRTIQTSAQAHLWQVVFSFFYLLVFPVLLFLLAGDWYWTAGWIFSIVFCALSLATVVYLYLQDPALLNERFGSPVQRAQKSWDKIFLLAFSVGYLVWFAIMPIDARRLRWSPEFPLSVETVGTGPFIISFIILFGAMKENTFAAPVVKMQRERGQKVISTGPYGIVRHPMYAGATLHFIGAPLLLGSVYGLAMGLLLIVAIALRSLGEEEMLKQELEGYDQYMRQVKWRLIPFVF